MKRDRSVSFAELRRLLRDLGFAEKRAEAACIFHHAKEGLVVFRRYREADSVSEGDLVSTRKFLDLRGLLDSEDFDALLQTTTPA